MKTKIVFLSIAVVLVLLAIYGIWHYSPLRYLTQSTSGGDQTRAAVENRRQPVIVAKRILPEQGIAPQREDAPPPVALKQINPAETSGPDTSQVQIEVPAAVEAKPPQLAPATQDELPQAAPGSQTEATQVASDDTQPAKVMPPRTVEPVKPAQPMPAKKQVAAAQQDTYYPYSIMLSSCRLPQSARKIVSDYKKAGLTPYVVKVRFESGDEWLRVLTGHYQTRRDALQAKKEHQLSSAIVKRTPYTNLIGTYASEGEMQADLQKIKNLGYSPYFFRSASGELKLMVGAFVTQEGAENQQTELQVKGVQNTVINR
ncbi:MAG: SPOR domain-containing protein [Desulfobacterales bacterium]|nr:SPOR domain-containing protein [Desulfobacterales bacterium]